jgi:hypothetical protein
MKVLKTYEDWQENLYARSHVEPGDIIVDYDPGTINGMSDIECIYLEVTSNKDPIIYAKIIGYKNSFSDGNIKIVDDTDDDFYSGDIDFNVNIDKFELASKSDKEEIEITRQAEKYNL